MVNTRIYLLTPTPLHAFMEDAAKLAPQNCMVKIADYKDFSDLIKIYSLVEDQADGFITSGNIAQLVIKKVSKTSQKPIASLGINLLGLYRLLLRQFTENKGLSLDRIFCDFLIPIRKDISSQVLLDEDQLVLVDRDIKAWAERSTLQELAGFQREASQILVDLWEQRKFDLMISTFGNVMTSMGENGIPCIYAYPNRESILDAFNNLLSTINLIQMRENLPVVVSISQKVKKYSDDSEVDAVSLHKCLLDFNGENLTDFIIQKKDDGFDIFTSLRVANSFTQSFQTCQLSQYLTDCLDFKVSIGYGVGNDIALAKANATKALQESAQGGGGSFVVDEKGDLIGPLNAGPYRAISTDVTPEILFIAEQAKLSVITIQKIAFILKSMKTDQLTTNDLAAKLGGTVRNAQRILGNLEKSGCASVLYSKSSNSKGRPVKVYQIRISESLN